MSFVTVMLVGSLTLAQVPGTSPTTAPPETTTSPTTGAAPPETTSEPETTNESGSEEDTSTREDRTRDTRTRTRTRRAVGDRVPEVPDVPVDPDVDAGARPRVEGPEPAPKTEVDVDVHTTQGTPPGPQWKGTGLLVTAGVLGAVGLGANIARIALVRRVCEGVRYDPVSMQVNGGDGCFSGAVGMGVLGGSALGFNMIAFGAAAGGGSLRGTWNAYGTAYAGKRTRAAGAQIGVGAGLMGVGLLGYAAVRIFSFVDFLGANSCGERHSVEGTGGSPGDSAFAECVRGRYQGYLAGITASQAMSVIGVGMLAHGASYRRNLRFYRAVSAHALRVQPNLAPTWAGLSLTGRF